MWSDCGVREYLMARQWSVHHPFDLTRYSIQPLLYTLHGQPATILIAKWQNQRDGALGSVHYLGDRILKKLRSCTWRVVLIFLDGILAQKTLRYIAADTL